MASRIINGTYGLAVFLEDKLTTKCLGKCGLFQTVDELGRARCFRYKAFDLPEGTFDAANDLLLFLDWRHWDNKLREPSTANVVNIHSLRIPAKVNSDSEGNANGIPG